MRPVQEPSQIELPHDLIARIDEIESKYGHVALSQHKDIEQAFVLAKGVAELRAIVTEPIVRMWLLPLQGSRLGFKCDDKGPYGWEVVRDVFIEATLRGARMIGNEVNIISGNLYLTKEFFERAVAEHPHVSNVSVRLGIPVTGPSGALVPIVVSYEVGGEAREHRFTVEKLPTGDEFDGRIPVRVNTGMGADAILGKATRKALARTYKILTGSNAWDGDADDEQEQPAAKSAFAVAPPKKSNEATNNSTELFDPATKA